MANEEITLEDIEKEIEVFESKECNNQNNLFMEGYRYCFDRFFKLIEQWGNKNKQLEQENKALIKLVNWCEECGFGFDNLPDDDVVNWEEFEEETNGMGYIESLIYYAKKYVENEELESKGE